MPSLHEKNIPRPLHPSASTPGGQLVLVATPIGHLDDISIRALEVLKNAHAILCEDTRITTRLLQHYGIHNIILPVHDHNEQERIPSLITRIAAGETLALVSDAGTPLVSDPGYRLVRAVIKAGLSVTAIPGANAAITALCLSGLPPAPFTFLGFPPKKEARKQHLAGLRAAEQAGLKTTFCWYEAPHRLVGMLADLREVFGEERPAAIGREITKHFEEMIRGSVAELQAHFLTHHPRGEITLLLGPAPEEDTGADELDRKLLETLATHSVKDAAALVATIISLPKKLVYRRALELSARQTQAREEQD